MSYKNVHFIFIFLLGVIITILFNTHKESFQVTKAQKNVILVGDSILKNNSYVSYDKSVEYLLNVKNGGNCYNFAQDGAIITDCYYQVDKVPYSLDNASSTIYLSVGGNDIITNYIKRPNKTSLTQMFKSYTKLVETVQTKLHLSTLVLLDVYYPHDIFYKPYYGVIKKWNNMIHSFVLNNANIHGLEVSNIFNKKADFTFSIEPSEVGTQKMVGLMIN
tara:strand:+ start:12346 stop:13002 length:657 start_codon:yes stop_codon:yes gene_type:complete